MMLIRPVLAAVVVSTWLITGAYAQAFDLSDAASTTCTRSTATVDVTSLPSTIGFDLQFAYDSSIVKAVAVDLGGLTTNCDFAANLNTPGVVTLSIACLNGVSGTGSIAEIDFDAVTQGASNLTFQSCQRDETNCSSATAGSVTISGCPSLPLSPATTGALAGTGPSNLGRACVGAKLTPNSGTVASVVADITYDNTKFSPPTSAECRIPTAVSSLGKTVTSTAVSSTVQRITVSGGTSALPTGGVFVCRFGVLQGTPTGSYVLSSKMTATDGNGIPVGTITSNETVKVITCVGNCDGSNSPFVSIGEVVRTLNEFSSSPVCDEVDPDLSCSAADSDRNGTVAIGEVVQSLNSFSGAAGCVAP